MKLHPDFDEVKFPYIVASGKNYFSWVNVKENLVSQFILSGRILEPNTDAFFFLKKRFGYSLHFVEDDVSTKGVPTFKWFEMELKGDFHKLMKIAKTFPCNRLKTKFKL